MKNMNIVCDKCNKLISENIFESCFYHNNEGGDLCKDCYHRKENIDKKRIQYLKNVIKLQGVHVVFNKELQQTKQFLKKYKIKKLKKKQYYTLLENVNKSLISKTKTKTNICNICYESLENDIYVGGECGHCFHKNCIELSNSYQCQLCRIHTQFIKLYL